MEKRDFGDETFRVTGKDIFAYASCVFLASIVPILLWGMATEEMAKTLFGDPEWWGIWTEPGGSLALMAVTLITGWALCRVSRTRVTRWFNERRVPAEEDAGR